MKGTYIFREAEVSCISFGVSTVVGRASLTGSAGGVCVIAGACEYGKVGGGWEIPFNGVDELGGNIPAALSDAINELSPPTGAEIGLMNGCDDDNGVDCGGTWGTGGVGGGCGVC